MSEPASGDQAQRHDPLAALKQPNYRFYASSRFFSATAMTLLQAALAWQVYEVSDSVFQLGVLGLVRFFPSLGLSLLGGAIADNYNRRNIVMLAQTLPIACSATLCIATAGGWVSLPVIYALVLLVAVASAFENPARQALLPSIVRPETFANAVTLHSSFQQLGFVSGPAVGGLIIAIAGVSAAYATHAVLLCCSLVCLTQIRVLFAGSRRAVSVEAIMEGIRFVRQRQVILGAMTLDMFAVIFGGAVALLPVFASDILDVGAWGYGFLTASYELGAFMMAITLVVRPPVERTGRALLVAVLCFGVGTIVFGLSRWYLLSLGAYMFIGMADQLSVVMRQTTIQLATPDELRGRVSSVNQVFVGASNQLGAVESGFVAAITGATFAVVSGGLGCIAVLGFVATKMPQLRTYRVSQGTATDVDAAAGPAAAADAAPQPGPEEAALPPVA